MVLNRLSSNLNTPQRTLVPVATAKKAASSKASSLGIGKAPASRTSRKRKAHPYGLRSSSVKRAKLSENADTPVAPLPTPSATATAPAITRATTVSEGAQVHTHITSPLPPPAQPSRVSVKVPSVLARPNLPPIGYINVRGTYRFANYVRFAIGPHLPYLFHTSTLFHAYPSVPSPEGHTIMSKHMSFPFGIPDVIEGRDQDGMIRATTAIYTPDVCLAIRQRSGNYRLIPTTLIVYNAQCVHFAALHNLDLQADFVWASTETPGDTMPLDLSSPITDDCGKSVSEFGDDDGASSDVSSASSDVSSASSSTYSSDSSEASSIVPLDNGGHIHLPVIALDVPHPESFGLIHTRLHYPTRQWQAMLLGLTTAEGHTPDVAFANLSILPFDEIQNRMRTVHGVWQNMVSLGLVDDDMWKELTSAWGMLYYVLTAHATGHIPVRLP